MRDRALTERIVRHGDLFSAALGIDLRAPDQLFRWLLASVLYGKRISEPLATRTYRQFEKAGVLSPERILQTGWDGLVQLLDAGGYTRYDFSTATRLLDLSGTLQKMGGLEAIHRKARDPRDLEASLLKLPGVGPTTANIFLRELRDLWQKADPPPSPLVRLAAGNLSVDLDRFDRKTAHFIRLECGLLRIGKDLCKKRKCDECSFRDACRKPIKPSEQR